MHGQLPNEPRCPNFDMSLNLHPFYVCESSEGSGEIAPKHINKDQKSHELAHFIFTKQDFCMKSSGSFLNSDQNKLLRLMAFSGNL